ncbi:MAG: ACP S-malonyltransferase [Actinobacteria bacterium]|nr:ACP S-malonyltransferase [Actinomycetota bacterium]
MLMSAVIGLDMETISKVLESYGESVFIANINDFSQIVISGYEDELLKASQKLVEAGTKKIIPLKVNIASHCPLMNGVSKTLEKYFGDNFKIPVTLSQAYFSSTEVSQVKPEDIPRVLINQLIKPVRWVESVQYLTSLYPADGSLKAFIEVGPGKVLSGLVRRILSKTGREDFMVFNTDSMEEIERI